MLDDYSPAAFEKQRRWYQDLRLRLHRSLNDATMTPDDRADLDIIEDQISLALLELQSIQDYRHDPTMYVELVGNALYAPFVLEYANKDKRYEHIINRLKAVPRFLGQARLNLSSAPEIWTRVAIAENEGNIALIDKELRDQAPAKLRQRYDEAAKPALEALRSFNALPGDPISSRRSYDWRLGHDKYTQKFRYTIATDQSIEQVLAAAEREMEQTRDEMYQLALKLTNSQPRVQAIRTASSSALWTRSRQNMRRLKLTLLTRAEILHEARQFVREKDLLTLSANDNLQVIETPEFMRGIYSVGGFNPAPALEPHLGAFYWLTPIPPTSAEGKYRVEATGVQLLRPEDSDDPRSDARTLRPVRVCESSTASATTNPSRRIRKRTVCRGLGRLRNRPSARTGIPESQPGITIDFPEASPARPRKHDPRCAASNKRHDRSGSA